MNLSFSEKRESQQSELNPKPSPQGGFLENEILESSPSTSSEFDKQGKVANIKMHKFDRRNRKSKDL